MSRKAIYPGTFDPFTNGHLDVLERALNIFDHVEVVLAENSQKQTLFSVDERLEMVHEVVREFSNVSRISSSEPSTAASNVSCTTAEGWSPQ